MKTCPNGHDVRETAMFCNICGAPVSIEEQSESAADIKERLESLSAELRQVSDRMIETYVNGIQRLERKAAELDQYAKAAEISKREIVRLREDLSKANSELSKLRHKKNMLDNEMPELSMARMPVHNVYSGEKSGDLKRHFCPKCGRAVPVGIAYCGRCGYKFG